MANKKRPRRQTHDQECIAAIEDNRNLLVPWYLTASYAYYEMDSPFLSDGLYDEICNRLLNEWDDVEHFHKHLIDKEALSAGTGYGIEYPDRVKFATYVKVES